MSGERILVVGAGYVGIVTAVGLVELGHRVELVETRADRREQLARGVAPIFEADVPEALGPAVAGGSIVVCATPSEARYDLVQVCVGTPIGDDGSSDLSQLRSALASIQAVTDGDTAVVIRSTMPVGGTRRVLGELALPEGQFFLNPEFLRQGTALADFRSPTRVVVGWCGSGETRLVERVESALAGLPGIRLRVTFEEAEIIKNAANAFLALKLSFTNEMALLTERYGGDIDQVLAGITSDPRIGATHMRPSFGFGGSCLPKELETVTRAGRQQGLDMHVTAAASAANASTQAHFAARIVSAMGGAEGKTVAVLGLAFKAGTDDVRESPGLAVARALHAGGARVRGWDPQASENALAALPWLEIGGSPAAAAADADSAVIATEWPELRAVDWAEVRATMRTPLIADGRRLLDPAAMRALGFRYLAVGTDSPRPSATSSPT